MSDSWIYERWTDGDGSGLCQSGVYERRTDRDDFGVTRGSGSTPDRCFLALFSFNRLQRIYRKALAVRSLLHSTADFGGIAARHMHHPFRRSGLVQTETFDPFLIHANTATSNILVGLGDSENKRGGVEGYDVEGRLRKTLLMQPNAAAAHNVQVSSSIPMLARAGGCRCCQQGGR